MKCTDNAEHTGRSRQHATIRPHLFKTPSTELAPWDAAVLCGALLLPCVIATGVDSLYLTLTNSETSLSKSELFRTLVAPAILLLFVFARWVTNYFIVWRRRRIQPYRWQRLCAMLAKPGASRRFPHRAAEHAFYREMQNIFRLERFLCSRHPGELIIHNGIMPGDKTQPRPTDITFKPMDIQKDWERMADYAIAAMCDPNAAEGIDGPKRSEHDQRVARLNTNTVRCILVLLAAGAIACLLSGSPSGAIWATLYILGILFFRHRSRFYERRWWIVPGGLVYRESRWAQSEVKIRLLTPKDTMLHLQVKPPNTRGAIIVDGKVIRFLCPYYAWQAVVAAWMSTATPPTMEQIESFIGEKTALGRKGHRPLAGDV